VLLAAIACTGPTACVTDTSVEYFGKDRLDPIYLHTVRVWEVLDDGQLLGYVTRQESPEAPDRAIYSVRNEWDQEVGMVDVLGRAWRYVPHAEEADWLGTGTLVEGAGKLLHARGEPLLVELDL
jgi:hypothetical protein